jgi:hypothetical protein
MTKPGYRGKRWRRAALTGLVIAAISLALLEIALRMLGLTGLVLYEEDPAAGFRLKPNQQVKCLGNTITINRWGVRDARPFDAKPPGVRRILVLGDSVTWGGIRERQENLFTHVLEEQLEDTEVVNAGVNGYSTAQMAALYETHLSELSPDLVLLYAIPGDFTRSPHKQLKRNSLAFPMREPRLAIPTAVTVARLALHQRLGWKWLRMAPAAAPLEELMPQECFERNVAAVGALAESLGGAERLLVVLSPTLDGDDPDDTAVALQGLGIRCIVLSEHAVPAADWFVDSAHLSTKGHGEVGRFLASLLEPVPAIPVDQSAE